MEAKKFTASDMRRALQMVREHLGPDAVILSSKKCSSPEQGDYVEIIASDDYSVEEVEAEHCAEISSVAKNIYERIAAEEKLADQKISPGSEARVELFSGNSGETAASQVELLKNALLNDELFRQQLLGESAANHARDGVEQEMDEMRYEIESLRRMLRHRVETQETEIGKTPQAKKISALTENLRHRLELMGVPATHHESLIKPVSHHTSVKAAWRELLVNIQNRIKLVSRDWVDAGGVFALIGPTGAGKTTTIAKLATRYALQYGPEQVGLISLDSQRVGGTQQLQTMGKLLGIPVRVVSDSNKFDIALRAFRNRSLVLIDTAGIRPGDPAIKKQLRILQQDSRIKALLTLPVTSQYPVLKTLLHAYQSVAKGLVFTKLDEAMSMGEVIATAIDSNLPLAYTTDGQLIPESIALPNLPELMALAVEKIRSLYQIDRQENGVGSLSV